LDSSSGYYFSRRHHFPLSDGNTLAGYEGVGNPGFALFVLDPLNVVLRILFPVLPRTGIVGELKFVHHDDAFFNGTYLSAFAATDAILIIDIVKAVRGRIETLVRTLGPTESTLRTEIEPDRRSLRLGGAALEARVSGLSSRAHLEAALHRRYHGSLFHLQPLGRHRDFVRPLDAVVRGHRPDARRLGFLA